MSNPSVSSERASNRPARSVDFRRSVAVIIGINDYANGIAPLTTAAHDARRLATILQAEHGYEARLLVEAVTKSRLTALFQTELLAEVTADDRLLVYFAGHGIALDGDAGPAGYLIPQDSDANDRASFLSMTEFHGWLDALPCRHLLVLLDCCFAGAFRWSSTRHLQARPQVIHKERYDRFIQSPAWQVLTSAAYDQTALDLLAGDVKRGIALGSTELHSPFAQALFQALAGAGDFLLDGKGDGVITATELYIYLRNTVEPRADDEANHKQTPELWPLKKHRKGEYIFLTPGHALNLPPAPELTAETNPYRGLNSYERRHARLFFGRTQQIEQLAAVVAAHPLTVVLGASGTGKSSLVKAGLLPYLQPVGDDGQPIANEWQILDPIRPGDQPLHTLTRALVSALSKEGVPGEIATSGVAEAVAPSALLAEWLATHPERRLLLVIDQFEELITQCRDETERMQFQQILADALQAHPEQLRIVLTLRSDFEPQFADAPLAPAWQPGRYVAPPLNQAELRAVIEGPASEQVLYFEPPELVDRLIDEVIQTPNALPLLSFTLSEMYINYVESASDNRALTQAHYTELGGVIGSLRTRATQEHNQLPDDAHRATMRRVMLRMVSTEGGELTRRRVPLSELKYPTAAENERVAQVIDRLVEARLLVRDSGDLDADGILDSYVEPAHDALVRAWEQLLVWQREAALYLPLQRRLNQAARAWQQATADDKTGLLWNNDPGLPQVLPRLIKQTNLLDTLLDPLQAFWPSASIAGLPDWLNATETEFVQQSVKQRVTLRRRVVLTTLGVILALATIAIVAIRAATVNKSNALAANAQRAIQNKDYDLAIALALEANQILQPPELAQNTLAAAAYVPGTQRYFADHTAEVTGAAFSPDGHYALTGSLDQSAILYDLTSGAIVHRLDASQIVSVTSVAYSPTGVQALLGLGDGTLAVWDLTTGAILQRLPGHTGAVTALAYAPDGKRALSGDEHGTLVIWDIAQGTEIRRLVDEKAGHTKRINAVAISRNGQTALSAASDRRMLWWDLETGQLIDAFEGHRGRVIQVAFDPENDYVLSGSTDNTVRAWNTKTGAVAGFNLDEHTQAIDSIAIAPDSSTAVSGAWDGAMLLWGGPPRGELIHAFVGHRAPVSSLAYSNDGRHVLSGSKDGTVRLWDIGGPAQLRRISVERLESWERLDTANTLAVDTERYIALSGSTNKLILWDLASGNEIRRIATGQPPVRDALVFRVRAYDPAVGAEDGNGIDHIDFLILDTTGKVVYQKRESQASFCAFGGGDPSCGGFFFADYGYQWPAQDGKPGEPIRSDRYTLRAIASATDGISTTLDTPIEIQLPAPAGQVIPLIEAPPAEMTRTLSGSDKLVVEMMQIGLPSRLFSVALSPDGQSALVGADGDLNLWDLQTGKKLLRLHGHDDEVINIVYQPDGQVAFSVSRDGLIIRWNLQNGEEQHCDISTRSGETVWSVAFHPTEPTAVASAEIPALSGVAAHSVTLWDLQTCQPLRHFDGHHDAVYRVAISPDGATILTGSADRSLIVWDYGTGQPVRHFEGHTLPVRVVAYSGDGSTILSGSEDKSVRLWNIKTGAEIFRFEGHSRTIQNVRYLPGAEPQLLSRAVDGMLILWKFPLLDLKPLIAWTPANRYVRALTCDERTLYDVRPLCSGGG